MLKGEGGVERRGGAFEFGGGRGLVGVCGFGVMWLLMNM